MDVESKKLIKNSGLNIAGSVLNKGGRYIAVFLLIKLFGVTNYGYYVLGLTIINMGSILSVMGLNYGIFRFVPLYRGRQDTRKVKGVVLYSVKLALLFSLVVSIVIFFASGYISNVIYNKPDLNLFIRILVFTLPFAIISMCFANVLKGFKAIKYKVIIEDISIPLLRIFLLLGCLLFGFNLMGVLCVDIVTVIFGSALGLWLVLKVFPELYDKSIKAICEKREIISFSFPLFLSAFMKFFINRTDILMLSYYLSAKQIGIYSVSQRMADVVFFFAASTFSVFSPVIAEFLGKGEHGEIEKLFQKITRWSLIATLPIYVIMVVFSEEILRIFGKEFNEGRTSLIILSTCFLVSAVVGYSGQVLGMMGRSKLSFINSLIAGLTNIVLNLFFIPKYGIVGAALATAISIIAVNIARTVEVYFLDKLSAFRINLFYPLAIGGILGMGVMYIKHLLYENMSIITVISLIILFCSVYLGLILKFGFDEEDAMLVQSFKSKFFKLQRT